MRPVSVSVFLNFHNSDTVSVDFSTRLFGGAFAISISGATLRSPQRILFDIFVVEHQHKAP